MAKMDEKFKNLPLRNCVGIIVLNKENRVLVARRIDNPKNFWQMPQGGIDEGEDFLMAAYRELEEETSIKNVELIKELDGTSTALPFECYYAVEVEEGQDRKIEKLLHETFDEHRVRHNREFFYINAETAKSALIEPQSG